MKSNKFKILIFLLSSIIVNSCITTQDYHRPENIINDSLFRTDYLPQDSISLADYSYKEIFKDYLLQKYIGQALEKNKDIRIALSRISIADAYYEQAISSFFPSLSISPGVTYTTPSLNSATSQSGSERKYITQYDITARASWELDIWGKLRSQSKANYAAYLQTVAAHQAVTSYIVSNVASVYFRLLALDEQLYFTKSMIAIMEESLKTTEALKEAGTVTEVAVRQTSAQLLNMKSRKIEIDNQIYIAENQLCLLLGETGRRIERMTIEEQTVPEQIQLGVPLALLRNRPDVRSSEFNLMRAFHQTNVAEANFYPALTLTANAGLQSLDLNQLFSINSLFANILGGLTQPILQRGMLKTELKVSELEQEQALLDFEQTLLQAGQEVSDALQVYKTQDELISIKKQEYENYSQASEYSQELLNYGMANYLEVLSSRQNALNAQIATTNAHYSKLNALVTLYVALGGGWR